MTAPACRVCGRRLRSTASQARGLGPVCARATQGRTAVRIPTPHPDHHIPGQAELPLSYRQVSLWSL